MEQTFIDQVIESVIGATVSGVAAYNLYSRFMRVEEDEKRWKDNNIKYKFRERTRIGNMDKPGVLLLHGFSSSPYDFDKLMKILDKTDRSYYAGNLPGHDPDHGNKLQQYSYRDWRKSAYHFMQRLLRYSNGTVDVIGFSLGGLLTLDLLPDDHVRRGVIINPFTKLPVELDVPNLAYRINPVLPYIRKISNNINSPDGQQEFEPLYKHIPILAYLQVQEYANKIWEHARKGINKPLLFAYSAKDTISCPKSMAKYAVDVCVNRYSQIKVYSQSDHGILFDYDSERVNEDILKFITQEDTNEKLEN